MIKLLLINILVMAMFTLTHVNSEDPETKYLVVDPDKIDYKFTGKNDEHRFGVEVKENKQFHHTRTEEDGVRLGCYGYVHPNGKAYSTHYVADNKGYRIVPHQGEILVYPKDGSVARMASFFESFNEDEIKSSNIRYFFPNGCKSTMIDIRLIDPSATPKPYVSPQFDTKTNADLKLVPGVATSINQDNKNFPTNIIPIVTGTVIQTKLNQNKNNNSNKGGIANTIERVPTEIGSGISSNAKIISEKTNKNSDEISSGTIKNTENNNKNLDKISSGNIKNTGNHNNNNDENNNNNNDENHNNNNDENHNNDNDENHNNDSVENHNSNKFGTHNNKDGEIHNNKDGEIHNSNSFVTHNNKNGEIHHSNSNENHNSSENKSDNHTIPIYSRTSEKSSGSISGSKTITGKNLDNRYLPTGEVEIEEPEKNEFLKIDQVTPLPTVSVTSATTNAAVVPLKPIFPGIPSNPIVPISPSKTIVPVSSTKEVIPAPFKPSEPIVPAIPSKPSVPLIPSKPSVPLIPSKPSVPLIPSKPSVPLIPSIPSSIPIDPVAPFSPSKPIIPKNPNQKVNPSNPIAATDNNNQCQDCCEDTLRPTLLMARNSEATCCKKDVAKLSIPISMDKLAKIAMSELIEITSETNTITMLKKLLALAEKYQF